MTVSAKLDIWIIKGFPELPRLCQVTSQGTTAPAAWEPDCCICHILSRICGSKECGDIYFTSMAIASLPHQGVPPSKSLVKAFKAQVGASNAWIFLITT